MRIAALLILLVIVAVQPSRAADGAPAIDIMLALDNSGSMQKNDPQRLLTQVVATFASKLGPEDRLGLVAFDQMPRVLLPMVEVKGSGFFAVLSRSLRQVNYTGKLTDIPGGLEAARKEIETNGRSGAQRIIVLLTDGDIDLGSDARNSDRKAWLRGSILPAAARQGIRIFGVTLTADADIELIQSMAEATQGNYYRLLSAREIPGVFDGILARLQEIRDKQAADRITATEAEERERKERERRDAVQAAPQIIQVAPPVQPPINVIVPNSAPAMPTLWIVSGAAAIILILLVIVFMLRRREPIAVVPAARLMDLGRQTGDAELLIKDPLTRIGLLPDKNDIVVKGDGISREHALIEFKDDAFYVRDLRSTNGTFLNDARVDPDAAEMLKHGDVLRFGPYSFRFVTDHLLKAEVAQDDGTPAFGSTMRLDQAPAVRAGSAGANAAAPRDTLLKLDGARSAAKPAATWLKPVPKSPSGDGGIALGDHCDLHQARAAKARCANCGHLICEFEDPVDRPDGGKVCRAFASGGKCPNQPASRGRETA